MAPLNSVRHTDELRDAQKAVHALRKARERGRNLSRSYADAIRRANDFRDPDLSAEGLHKRKQEMRQKARDEHQRQVERLQRDVEYAEEDVRHYLDQLTASPSADQVARRESGWNRSKMLLDSGRSARDVIEEAPDEDTLLALRDYLPVWQQAQTKPERGIGRSTLAARQEQQRQQRDALHLAIDQKLAEAGTSKTRHAAQYRTALATELPVARAQVDGTHAEVTRGASSLATVIAVKQAEGATRVVLDDSDDGADDE